MRDRDVVRKRQAPDQLQSVRRRDETEEESVLQTISSHKVYHIYIVAVLR